MINIEIRMIIFLQSKIEKLYTVSKKQDWELNDSDYELLITKFRLKWRKVVKPTRPFKYDLNQIS